MKSKEDEFVDAMENSKEEGKFTNYFDQRVEFIIKLDKPFLSFNFNSLQLYCKLLSKGLETGRPDLLKKGESLLRKHLFVDIDKFLLQYENDQKMR